MLDEVKFEHPTFPALFFEDQCGLNILLNHGQPKIWKVLEMSENCAVNSASVGLTPTPIPQGAETTAVKKAGAVSELWEDSRRHE